MRDNGKETVSNRDVPALAFRANPSVALHVGKGWNVRLLVCDVPIVSVLVLVEVLCKNAIHT